MRHGDNITQRKDGKIDYSGVKPEKSFKSVAEEWLDIRPDRKYARQHRFQVPVSFTYRFG